MATTPHDPSRFEDMAEVFAKQLRLQNLPNEELIMLGLAELIAFMPKSQFVDTDRSALWRELWRRGTEKPVIKGA